MRVRMVDAGMLGIDSARLQLTPYECAVLVVAGHAADVPGAQSHRRARAQCGRRLSAAQNGVMRNAQLGSLRVGMRELGQAVYVVDRGCADTDDIERDVVHASGFSLLRSRSGSVRGSKLDPVRFVHRANLNIEPRTRNRT